MSDLEQILESSVWEEFFNRSSRRSDVDLMPDGAESHWDARSASFARKSHHPMHRRLALELLDMLDLKPHESVLDVGAGPGTYTIPAANMTRHVTAVDISSGMLSELEARAATLGLNNISCVRSSWQDYQLSTRSDVMICFNALGCIAQDETGAVAIGPAVDKLLAAAERGYILVSVVDKPADEDLCRALGLEGPSVRLDRAAVLFNIFASRGIMPEIRLLNRDFFWAFEDADEGTALIGKRLGIKSDSDRFILLDRYLRDRYEVIDGSFIMKYPVPQILMSWGRRNRWKER